MSGETLSKILGNGGLVGILGCLAALGFRAPTTWPGWYGLWTVLAVSVVAAAVLVLRGRRPRRPTSDEVALGLVQFLHGRWFPEGNGLDRRFRVSIFVPQPNGATPKQWTCIARTTTKAKASPWQHETDREKLPWAGLVVTAAVNGASAEAVGIPPAKRGDPAEVRQYLERSKLNEERQRQRSWPWASLSVRLARASNGTISCVLVVEREDGEPITVMGATPPELVVGGHQKVDLCGWELQFAAELLAKAWEEAA